MYIERFIHDADKSKLHDFLLREKLTENLVYGYAEQDIVYRRIESEKSYIKMRAKKYVDIKDNIAMITLHNVKRTYRSVMEMKRVTLVLNANHPLVQFLVTNKDSENVSIICKQLYDLAMLAHKPLSPEEMTAFVKRSNDIMMLLTK